MWRKCWQLREPHFFSCEDFQPPPPSLHRRRNRACEANSASSLGENSEVTALHYLWHKVVASGFFTCPMHWRRNEVYAATSVPASRENPEVTSLLQKCKRQKTWHHFMSCLSTAPSARAVCYTSQSMPVTWVALVIWILFALDWLSTNLTNHFVERVLDARYILEHMALPVWCWWLG